MRTILCLTLLSALASVPASAQSTIPLDPPARVGPNAQASQRPLGPNAQVAAQAAKPSAPPNLAVTQASKAPEAQVYYPTCPAAGAVRTTPIRQGEPGYGRHLDRDGDGIACE
jgi:hypothetical protein